MAATTTECQTARGYEFPERPGCTEDYASASRGWLARFDPTECIDDQFARLVSIFQRGRRWYAHYRVDGKPVRQSLKTSSKKEARRKALAIERDLINGRERRPKRAPTIKEVVDEYISHLRAQRRSPKTITKYTFGFTLMLELAAKRGITRID